MKGQLQKRKGYNYLLSLLGSFIGFIGFMGFMGFANLSLSQVIITNDYTQNFNNLSSGLPDGWSTYRGISSSSLGTSLAFTNTNPSSSINSWANTSGAFKNFASSTGLSQTSSVAAQQASLDRALGLRPTAAFGDSATNFVSINFNFSTLGYEVSSLSLDAMVLATETRTKLWDIEYGLGASPTTWITLDTFSSSTNWLTVSYAFSPLDFGTSLDNQSSVWFRFSSTSLSTGSGSRPTVAIDNFALSASIIPEPRVSILLLMGMGASLLGITAYRKWVK